MPPSLPVRTFQLATAPFICLKCRLRIPKRVFRHLTTTSTRRHQTILQTTNEEQPVTESPNPAKASDETSSRISIKSRRTREPKLPDRPARTRFAPSPTGYLHIGGLRTALFSYLLAKRTGGQFLLRIEDTDQKRLVPDAEAKLYEDLRWAGLHWDEGPLIGGPHGPYRQSERTDIYQAHARQLFDQSTAYACFCAPQSVAGHQSTAYVTSGCYQNCSTLSREEARRRADVDGQPYTVRLHQPSNAGSRRYTDLVYGQIKRLKRSPAVLQPSASPEDGGDVSLGNADTILMKTDGTPTYHFANVVDDHLMGITHVIRGVEWMASTPLHYDIYSAFGWEPPEFAHVGLLVDENKAKLSKRNTDLGFDVASMRQRLGVFPRALNNFIALLGWSNPTRNDLMDMESLISNFDLKFTRGNTVVTTDKLWYLQKGHIKNMCASAEDKNDLNLIKDIATDLAAQVRKSYTVPVCGGEKTLSENIGVLPDQLSAYCADILLVDAKNFTNAEAFVKRNQYFFEWDTEKLPRAKEVYAQGKHGIPLKMMRDCAEEVFNTFEWGVESKATHELFATNKNARGIDALALRLQSHLRFRSWFFILTMPFQRAESARAISGIDAFRLSPEDASDFLAKYHSSYTEQPSLKSMTPDLVAYLTHNEGHIGHSTSEPQPILESDLSAALTERRTVFTRYLRDQLAYGLPGPDISRVMAILGRT